MESTSPVYHPKEAKNYINLTNNLNPNDTYVWYDSDNPGNIMFPSIFTYKKTSSWSSGLNLRLNSVVLNSASGSISEISPVLPSAEGKFNATLKLQNSSAPTMDLYFTGNIIKKNITYSVIQESSIYHPDSVSVTGLSYSLNPGDFPSNNITVNWTGNNPSYSFNPATFTTERGRWRYVYDGDFISFTTTWGQTITSENRSDSKTITGPTSSMLESLENIPTIYCNWGVRAGYTCETVCYDCNCDYDCGCDYGDCDCGCDSGDGGGYGEIVIPAAYLNPYMGVYGATATKRPTATTSQEAFVPAGSYPAYEQWGWVGFNYDGSFYTYP